MGKDQNKKRTARDEAMYFLEHRARTAEEVRGHLRQKEYDEEEIGDCMSFLEDCHFVDDSRYARSYVEYALEKGRGPQRIRMELSRRGVSGELIEIALEELCDSRTQFQTALRQAEKALGLAASDSWDGGCGPAETGGGDGEDSEDGRRALTEKELARAARRLAGLGYSSSVVYDVLRRLKRC